MYSLFLSDFNQTQNCSTEFQKTLKYQISSKSVQWESSGLMWTDMTKLTAGFRNFAVGQWRQA